jgi:hypothetical protein
MDYLNNTINKLLNLTLLINHKKITDGMDSLTE